MTDLVDLVALLEGSGWSPARIVALRNTCSAVAGKDTFPESERAMAAAVEAALSGRTAGIERAHLEFLQRTELI
jgi:hypothetical protein